MAVTSRRERAVATRRRMLEAGRDVFAEAGYTAATMRAIAIRARVAPQTLYFTFGSKPNLFGAVMEYASSGEIDHPAPVPERGWYREAVSARSARRALGLLIEGGVGIVERIGPLSQAVDEAAAEEPAITGRQAELAASRRRGIRRLVEHLASLGGLRPGLTQAEAADVIYVLFAPDTFRRFAACGWSIADWRRWLSRSLGELILGDRS